MVLVLINLMQKILMLICPIADGKFISELQYETFQRVLNCISKDVMSNSGTAVSDGQRPSASN